MPGGKYAGVRGLRAPRGPARFRAGLRDTPTREEALLVAAFDRAGVAVDFQATVRTAESFAGYYVVDLAIPSRQLLVEVDGKPHVGEVAAWRDRLRDEAILRARPGWRLRRVWNAQVREDADAVVVALLA